MMRADRVVWGFLLVALASGYHRYVVDNPVWMMQGYPRTTQSRQIQQKCTEELPCYDVTLNYVLDGICPFEPGPNPNAFLNYYKKANLGVKDIIADGQEAAKLFKERTGLDFTDLPKMAYLNSDATALNGSVLFSPIYINEKCKYRLTTAQKGEQVQLINKPVLDAGWILVILKETRVYGSINRILPAGTLIAAGSYLIEPCQKNDKECKSILFPDDPHKIIFIRYITRKWLSPDDPDNVTPIDCILGHPKWGIGIARGVGFPASQENARTDTVNVLRFQWPIGARD